MGILGKKFRRGLYGGMAVSLVGAAIFAAGTVHAMIGGRAATDTGNATRITFTTSGRYCSGALVKADWVITAKHCTVTRTPPGDVPPGDMPPPVDVLPAEFQI